MKDRNLPVKMGAKEQGLDTRGARTQGGKYISRAIAKELLRRIAAAERVFCFLDYDGTLSNLAPKPHEAVALPGTSALVRQLATAPGTQVALVSGRSVTDLRRFLDIPDIYYVGIHGAEIRLPTGEVQMADGIDAVSSALPEIKRELQAALSACAGILIEDKGAALACHYRLATRRHGAAARQLTAALVQDVQARGVPITLVRGHQVVEIRPALINKGKAICAILAAAAPGALPLYVGDDQTDEDAFALLPPESITIRVAGSRAPTRAGYRVREPRDVHQFLQAVLEARTHTAAAAADGAEGSG